LKTVEFTGQLIATCGMNCALCVAFQRIKNSCCGCNVDHTNKVNHTRSCIIKNCPELETSEIKFCFVCAKFPCKRLKQLDKRYQLKYGMSMFVNLQAISKDGIDEFIASQQKKWQCSQCGSLLCVHRNACLHCGNENPYFPTR
jgi:hypothetical protein